MAPLVGAGGCGNMINFRNVRNCRCAQSGAARWSLIDASPLLIEQHRLGIDQEGGPLCIRMNREER